MALTIPDFSEDRGISFVDPLTKSSATKGFSYRVDPQGCGNLTHAKSGATITINEFDPTTCKIVVYVSFSWKSITKVEPVGTAPNEPVFTPGDFATLLDTVNQFYAQNVGGVQLVQA
jgi:hypothetical protein